MSLAETRGAMTAVSLLLSMAVLGALLAGCSLIGTAEPTFCDGISSELGGCAANRPAFDGQTCDEVASEFGRQLDERLMAIYTGPESREESKSVRASAYTLVAAGLANQHIRRLGLIKECSAPAFLAKAEAEFSADLKAHVGELLDDGEEPAPYDTWRAWLLSLLSIIDLEEDAHSPR